MLFKITVAEFYENMMQPIPTNCHFRRRCEAFLSGHFCRSEFIPRLSRDKCWVRFVRRITQDFGFFDVDKMLSFLIPVTTRVDKTGHKLY